ncbi:MAG: hypothetical protein K8T25_04790 [Planctomycetia bacterium]|nr:hypothetical protein [Planctomycetia bacterium]
MSASTINKYSLFIAIASLLLVLTKTASLWKSARLETSSTALVTVIGCVPFLLVTWCIYISKDSYVAAYATCLANLVMLYSGGLFSFRPSTYTLYHLGLLAIGGLRVFVSLFFPVIVGVLSMVFKRPGTTVRPFRFTIRFLIILTSIVALILTFGIQIPLLGVACGMLSAMVLAVVAFCCGESSILLSASVIAICSTAFIQVMDLFPSLYVSFPKILAACIV